MKTKHLSVALTVALAASVTCTSCIGSFSLTNKMLSWNKQIGNKFVNEVVFFAFWVLPVYEVAALADILVLNSIEFWSGNNPIAKGTKVIQGEHDRYLVECDGKGYTIRGEKDPTPVRLDFKCEDQSWNLTVDGMEHKLFTFVDDEHIKVIAPDGTYQVVELSQAGVYAYRNMAMAQAWAAR